MNLIWCILCGRVYAFVFIVHFAENRSLFLQQNQSKNKFKTQWNLCEEAIFGGHLHQAKEKPDKPTHSASNRKAIWCVYRYLFVCVYVCVSMHTNRWIMSKCDSLFKKLPITQAPYMAVSHAQNPFASNVKINTLSRIYRYLTTLRAMNICQCLLVHFVWFFFCFREHWMCAAVAWNWHAAHIRMYLFVCLSACRL